MQPPAPHKHNIELGTDSAIPGPIDRRKTGEVVNAEACAKGHNETKQSYTDLERSALRTKRPAQQALASVAHHVAASTPHEVMHGGRPGPSSTTEDKQLHTVKYRNRAEGKGRGLVSTPSRRRVPQRCRMSAQALLHFHPAHWKPEPDGMRPHDFGFSAPTLPSVVTAARTSLGCVPRGSSRGSL